MEQIIKNLIMLASCSGKQAEIVDYPPYIILTVEPLSVLDEPIKREPKEKKWRIN